MIHVRPMNREDVVKNYVSYAPIKFGSLTTRSPRASRLSQYMSRTSSCATFSSLRCLSSPTFFSYEPRTAGRLVLPREGWYFHHRPSLPWNAGAVTATGRVTNQHKLRLAADESNLAASLEVPPPKKKTPRSEEASQRKIVERHKAGMTPRLRPRPAHG